MMEDMLSAAAENMLDLFGREAILKNGNEEHAVRVSPLFRIPRMQDGTREHLTEEGNLLMEAPVERTALRPGKTRLILDGEEWFPETASSIGKETDGKRLYELTVRR